MVVCGVIVLHGSDTTSAHDVIGDPRGRSEDHRVEASAVAFLHPAHPSQSALKSSRASRLSSSADSLSWSSRIAM